MAKVKALCLLVLALTALAGASLAGTVEQREKATQVATGELGVREATGRNDGAAVEKYLRSVNLGKGYAWCAAFISWVYQQCSIPSPKSAWAPAWFPVKNIVYKRSDGKPITDIAPMDVFGLYFPEQGRIAHVGLVLCWDEKSVTTIEGNTNNAGSREGDGVYKKKRLRRQIAALSRWI